jgi:hypothetical protein
MNFWSHTSAVPSAWQVSGFATLKPRYIRTMPPIEMTNPVSDTQIFRATSALTHTISAFLTAYYGGSDWSIHVDLSTYINDPHVIVLCMRKETTLIGMIVSTPLTAGKTYMSHGGIVDMRVIEGLCIHPEYRSKGLAGILINQMDMYTHTLFGPTAHLWSREMATTPFFSTALTTQMYGYIHCEVAAYTPCEQMPWKMFVGHWRESCRKWLDKPCIVADTPLNRRNDLTVWIADANVAVIANTRRTSGSDILWEVVWCGILDKGLLWPLDECGDFLESVAANIGHGILFTSDYVRKWKKPWIYGTSGYHSWYMYNYIPPAFRTCKIHAIREEL